MTTMASSSSLSAVILLLAVSTIGAVVAASQTNIQVETVERRYPEAGDLCVSDSKTFTVSVDLYAGELGSYVLEECGEHLWNPTIAMEIGETYTFVQKHRTNYYHRTFCTEFGSVFLGVLSKKNTLSTVYLFLLYCSFFPTLFYLHKKPLVLPIPPTATKKSRPKPNRAFLWGIPPALPPNPVPLPCIT